MLVGSTPTIALSNMAEVCEPKLNRLESSHRLAHDQAVSFDFAESSSCPTQIASTTIAVDAVQPANYHPRALHFDILWKD